MLGVSLRKLCPVDSFGYASRKEDAKAARGGSKMASGRPPGGSFVPVGPNFAAKAARKPFLNGPGGALGTLVTLLEPSWGPPGASRATPGRLLGVLWRPPKC